MLKLLTAWSKLLLRLPLRVDFLGRVQLFNSTLLFDTLTSEMRGPFGDFGDFSAPPAPFLARAARR